MGLAGPWLVGLCRQHKERTPAVVDAQLANAALAGAIGDTDVRDIIDSTEGLEVKANHPWAASLSATMQIVEAFSKPGELALDPMCGTGTVGVAAVQLGRRFLGVDVDRAAVSLAAERLRSLGHA